MSGGQIAALIFAIILLLPGGCFLIAGIAFLTDASGVALLMLPIAAALLGLAGFLFRIALRRRQKPDETPGNPPS